MVTSRLERFIREAFDRATAEDVLLDLFVMVDAEGRPVSERIQAAAVIVADGDLDRLAEARKLAAVDWRDLLVLAGLASEDWLGRLDEVLGPES